MKKILTIPIWICLLLIMTVACKNSRKQPYSPPPPKGSATIAVTNVEIQPNPFHLWPSSNYKIDEGQYRAVVTLTNTGTDVCTSKLFFTMYVRKADQFAGDNKEFSIGGATLEDQILVNEKRYVIIPMENWLRLHATSGDYDNLAGSYKTRIEVVTNDGIPIDQNMPVSLFQIIKH